MDSMLTIAEIADTYAVSCKTVRRWIANYGLEAKRLPGGVYCVSMQLASTASSSRLLTADTSLVSLAQKNEKRATVQGRPLKQ